MKSRLSAFHGPKVSTATGTNVCVDAKAAYFWTFIDPALVAAAPADEHVVLK